MQRRWCKLNIRFVFSTCNANIMCDCMRNIVFFSLSLSLSPPLNVSMMMVMKWLAKLSYFQFYKIHSVRHINDSMEKSGKKNSCKCASFLQSVDANKSPNGTHSLQFKHIHTLSFVHRRNRFHFLLISLNHSLPYLCQSIHKLFISSNKLCNYSMDILNK